MPQTVKDVEKFLSDELQSRKKEVKQNAWNVNNKIGMPKEKKMYDNKVEEGVDDSEASDVSDNSDEEEEIDSTICDSRTS